MNLFSFIYCIENNSFGFSIVFKNKLSLKIIQKYYEFIKTYFGCPLIDHFKDL